MFTWKNTIRIAAPRQRVWDALADFDHAHEWNPNLTRAVVETSGPLGQGTRIRTENGSAKTILTVEECAEPRLMRLTVVRGRTRGNSRFTLSSDPQGGTSLEHVLKLETAGFMHLVALVMGGRLKRELAGLKLHIESSP